MEPTYTKDQVIALIKRQWIADFDRLDVGGERNGYFFVGFVDEALSSSSAAKRFLNSLPGDPEPPIVREDANVKIIKPKRKK